MNEHVELISRALSNYRSDNLERARMAYRGCTQKELDEPYGQSGKTPRQILAEYQQHVDRVDAAQKWLSTRA